MFDELHISQSKIDPDAYSGLKEYYENKKPSFKEAYDNFRDLYQDDISTEQRYEYWDNIKQYLHDCLMEGEFKDVVSITKSLLIDFAKINSVEEFDITNPADCIRITGAVSWAAKDINEIFYSLKPAMIVAAANLGARIGVYREADDKYNIYYLFSRDYGMASFHNPSGEVMQLFKEMGVKQIKEWEFDWDKSMDRRHKRDVALNTRTKEIISRRNRSQSIPGKDAQEKRGMLDYIDEHYKI